MQRTHWLYYIGCKYAKTRFPCAAMYRLCGSVLGRPNLCRSSQIPTLGHTVMATFKMRKLLVPCSMVSGVVEMMILGSPWKQCSRTSAELKSPRNLDQMGELRRPTEMGPNTGAQKTWQPRNHHLVGHLCRCSKFVKK